MIFPSSIIPGPYHKGYWIKIPAHSSTNSNPQESTTTSLTGNMDSFRSGGCQSGLQRIEEQMEKNENDAKVKAIGILSNENNKEGELKHRVGVESKPAPEIKKKSGIPPLAMRSIQEPYKNKNGRRRHLLFGEMHYQTGRE